MANIVIEQKYGRKFLNSFRDLMDIILLYLYQMLVAQIIDLS